MKCMESRCRRDFQTPTQRHRGFTLPEILTVTVVIVILAVIGLSSFRKIRENARSAVCIGNLRQVGGAVISYYSERSNQPFLLNGRNVDEAEATIIWPLVIAAEGYISNWDGRTQSTKPCGKGVWTCPSCDFMSDNYGGYGVVEGIFKYPTSAKTNGYRMSDIERPASTWLVGDVMPGTNPKKGWYALWQNPSAWSGGHAPAAGRHGGGRVNVCMFDGHVESLTVEQLKQGRYTYPAK